jgi:alkylation response protein AidB-like acyl-CoA dehydrogenase
VVERDAPGFTVGRRKTSSVSARAARASCCSTTAASPRVRCSATSARGYKVAIETLNEGRIGIGAQMIGLAQGALDHTMRYVKERTQFGKRIADFQGVQFQIARAATDSKRRGCSSTTPRRLRDAGSRF